MVRQELQAAVQVCPRLAPLVPAHVLADPASAGPADAARIAAAADELLPEAERNNGLSVNWGWRRHGPRVIAMLAIALEDPSIRDRCPRRVALPGVCGCRIAPGRCQAPGSVPEG